MNKLIAIVCTAGALALAVLYVVTAPGHAQTQPQAQVQEGRLPQCVSPERIVATAKQAPKYEGHHIFTAAETKKVEEYVANQTGDHMGFDTLVVVYFNDNSGIALFGKQGVVCDFVIAPASQLRDFVATALGRIS